MDEMTATHTSDRTGLSLIIPSYESQLTARATFDSLRKQTFRDFETIVVDSGPSDAMERIAADFPEIRFHRSERRLLPHEARNVGIGLATNDILVFTDPDIVADPEWLEKLIGAYRQNASPTAGAVACLRKNWLDTGVHLAKFDIWLPGIKTPTVPAAPTVNFLCRRELVEQAGGFEGREMIGDTRLSWKLIQLGNNLRFAPDAIVYHDHRSTFGQLVRERFARGVEFGCLRLEWERWNNARTWMMLIASVLPVRLIKLIGRVLQSTLRAGCSFDWLRTFPVIAAGHAAWLAGESTQYWRHLHLASGAD